MLIKPADFRITHINLGVWNGLRLRWAHTKRKERGERKQKTKERQNKININNSLVWLYSKEEEYENECRQRFSRACTALTQSRSHMQSNKCQSKLNFTEHATNSWGERVRVLWSNADETASDRIDRMLTGSSFYFLHCLSSSFTFSFCLPWYTLYATAIRTFGKQLILVIRRCCCISTWRNIVRWHGCCLPLLRKRRWFIIPLKYINWIMEGAEEN